jgi:restriction endonuclease Mrr
MLNLEPQKFEHLIKTVLEATGFERVSVTRYTQDGGVDVNAFAGPSFWPVSNLLVQVQGKRWLHTVGRREVAELRGSLQPFARGAIVTTSHYSKSAVKEALEPGKNPIVLVDGYEFATLVCNFQIVV